MGPTSPKKPETTLQKETRIFREELGRLGNCILNKTFDLTIKGSQRRNQALIILFLLLGMLFTFSTHPLAAWGSEIGLFFRYLLIQVC